MWKLVHLEDYTHDAYTSRKRRDKAKWLAAYVDNETGERVDKVELYSEHYNAILRAGYNNPPQAAEAGEIYVILDERYKIESVYCKDGGVLTVAGAKRKANDELYGV